MSNLLIIKKKIKNFNKTINVSGDKSLSIRWVLFSSLANGISKSRNLLMSEDVLAAIEAIRKLGIKVILKNKECIIYGKGINGYQYKKGLTIDAKNSGTLARLISGFLVNVMFNAVCFLIFLSEKVSGLKSATAAAFITTSVFSKMDISSRPSWL